MLRFFYNKNYPSNIYVNIGFNQCFNFIQRFYLGIVYLFNIKSDYLGNYLGVNCNKWTGEFDSIWDEETVNNAIKFLKQFRQNRFLYLEKKQIKGKLYR
jgi:hypothetical protein